MLHCAEEFLLTGYLRPTVYDARQFYDRFTGEKDTGEALPDDSDVRLHYELLSTSVGWLPERGRYDLAVADFRKLVQQVVSDAEELEQWFRR